MKFSEFMEIQSYFKTKEPKSVKVSKEFTFKDYLKFKKEMEDFQKLMKEDKKEEKKEDKKSGMSAAHLAMWMVATFPITGPLYFYYVSALIKSLQ